MLDIAIDFLRKELNGYLRARANSGTPGANTVEAKLSKVVDESGKYAFEEGSLCIALINVEEERVFKSQLPGYTYVNGQHLVSEPELKLNLYLLFAANLKIYDDSLKYISLILTYFQSHSMFTTNGYPGLDPQIGKLSVELQSLSFEQLNQVWAFLGGKQLPSVIYKVRMVVLQDEEQSGIQPPLTIINADLHRR